MAVVQRKRQGRVVYGVSTSWSGGRHWELVGPNKREAELVDARRRREVKAGTFLPGAQSGATSVAGFAGSWLPKRTNRSGDNDRQLITKHVLSVPSFAKLRMAEVRPRHVLKLIAQLKLGHLSPKSISVVMGVVQVMFRDAVIEEVIAATPYVVPRGTLKRSGKRRTPYTPDEVRALTSDVVGERQQVWNALAFYLGARCGEICGLRWKDWDEAPKPLSSMSIERQYAGAALKTERPRLVAVHPRLASLLAKWRERWRLAYRRRPGPEDLICPQVDGSPLQRSAAYKAWIRGCKAAGVTNRSVHSTRHTFITLTQRGGAPTRIVELMTHNPKGTIIDAYTTHEWAEFCAAVLALLVDAPVDDATLSVRNDGSSSWTRTRQRRGKHGERRESKQNADGSKGPESASDDDPDGPVDARQHSAPAWSLALAAESLLARRGTLPVASRRPLKGVRRVG